MPWAMGALPRPASLLRTPRLTPAAMAWATLAPMKPPAAAVGVNASPKICPNTCGSLPALIRMYTTAVTT